MAEFDLRHTASLRTRESSYRSTQASPRYGNRSRSLDPFAWLLFHGSANFPTPKRRSIFADSAPHRYRRTFRFLLADLMQPRDSVASRNSAVRHGDNDMPRPCRCQSDLIHKLCTLFLHSVENRRWHTGEKQEGPTVQAGPSKCPLAMRLSSEACRVA